jgi:hypothetical protein
MRSSVVVLCVLMAAPAAADPKPKPAPDITARLHNYYGSRTGYTKVYRDVMGWHKTTQNGCVAFASTALRHVGVAIPMDVRKDGRNVSRITGAFARYLAEDLKWTRIEVPSELRPGDVVFTTDAECCPGYPAHVMMFDGWVRRDRSLARFVDNQGFKVARPMKAVDSTYNGFQYALRPPPEESEPTVTAVEHASAAGGQ